MVSVKGVMVSGVRFANASRTTAERSRGPLKAGAQSADARCMEPDRQGVVLEADRSSYRDWVRDLHSPEESASGAWDETDWRMTRDACAIVLVSNN